MAVASGSPDKHNPIAGILWMIGAACCFAAPADTCAAARRTPRATASPCRLEAADQPSAAVLLLRVAELNEAQGMSALASLVHLDDIHDEGLQIGA